MKKSKVLFMLIPLVLAGCNAENKGTVIDLSDEDNKDMFIKDVSELLFNTCEELSSNGLQVEGKMDKMNLGMNIEAFYKDTSKSPINVTLGLKASGLADFKIKGIDQPAEYLHAEVNVKEFDGGLSISDGAGTNLDFLVEDAVINGYLMQNTLYLDTANEAFEKSFGDLVNNLEDIIRLAGLSEEDVEIPEEAKYLLSNFTTGEFNKMYLEEVFTEDKREKPVLGKDLYSIAYMNFQEDNIRKIFDEIDIYDLVTYKKFKHGDFSISTRLTNEQLYYLIGLEEDETLKNSVINVTLKTDRDKRLHEIDLNAQVNIGSINGPILGKYSAIDHYENTTMIDFDYKFNVYFDPQFTDINKAQFFNFFTVLDILETRYEELVAEQEPIEE